MIRTDASVRIGHGHAMRCLTLAKQLKRAGATVAFICRDCKGNLIDFIESKGFPVNKLPDIPVQYPGKGCLHSGIQNGSKQKQTYDWLKDAESVKTIIESNRYGLNCVDWLIVDHYDLELKWEGLLRPYVKRIMVIDDLPNREHDCDILLDQNYSLAEDRYLTQVPDYCLRLLGPKYALLRKKFLKSRSEAQIRSSGIRRLLVYFGGADLQGGTVKTVKALSRLKLSNVNIDVIIGQSNPRRTKIVEMSQSISGMQCHSHVENLYEIMARADLAVGACGTTTWERCCLGLPTLVATIAANQEAISEELAVGGYILLMGKCHQLTSRDIETYLKLVIINPYLLAHISANAMSLVDGEGSKRVLNYIMDPQLNLRIATYGDRHQLFLWRNAPENRRFSHSPEPISWETHEAWLKSTLVNDKRKLMIADINGSSVGVLRYDIDEDIATVSIYMVPGYHARGLGVWLLREGMKSIRKDFPGLKKIVAEIQHDNISSQKVFKKAGFYKTLTVYVKELHE